MNFSVVLSPKEVWLKFTLLLHTVAKNVTRILHFKVHAPLFILGADVFSPFLLRLFHLLNQIHSPKKILSHPLLPLFHPPYPRHQTLLAFYGLHKRQEYDHMTLSIWSLWIRMILTSFFFSIHTPPSESTPHSHLSLYSLPALNLPLLASSPSFFLPFLAPLSSVPRSPQDLLSCSLISRFSLNAGVIFRSHWKTRPGTHLPSLCGFNGFMKYTVSMSDDRNSKLYSSRVILKPSSSSSSTKAVSSSSFCSVDPFSLFDFYFTVVLTYSLEPMLSIIYKLLLAFCWCGSCWTSSTKLKSSRERLLVLLGIVFHAAVRLELQLCPSAPLPLCTLHLLGLIKHSTTGSLLKCGKQK